MTGVAEAIISFSLSYLFKQIEPKVHIQSAPTWYMKEVDIAKLTKSVYVDGDLNAIDKAKEKIVNQFVESINDSTTIAMNKYTLYIDGGSNQNTGPDPLLKDFINNTIIYENIYYDEDKKRAYIKASVLKSSLAMFQKQRIFGLRVKRLDHDFDLMMQELENETKVKDMK